MITEGGRRFVARLWNACFPAGSDAELEREVSAHLALIESDFERQGMAPAQARLAARRAFGGVDQTRERYRDERSFPWIDDLRRDLRYAARSFAREAGLAVVIVLTLAIGIGANTAIFSVVHAVLLQPLPYPDSSQLVRVWENVPAEEMFNGRAQRYGAMDVRDLLSIAPRARTVSHLAAYGAVRPTATFDGMVTRLVGASVSPNMFAMAGVAPLIGRAFTSSDTDSTGPVVLSYETWRRFGSVPDIVGRTLTFSGDASMLRGVAPGLPYTVIGVMPRGFNFPYGRTEIWFLRTLAAPTNGRPLRLETIARVSAGHTPREAAAELAFLRHEIPATHSPFDAQHPRYELIPLHDELAGPVTPALLALTAGVGVVLLIACVNVAHLLLLRAATREREFAMRAALGAGQTRLVRQLLTESLLLSVCGAAAGIAVALAGVEMFKGLASGLGRTDLNAAATFPRLADIAVDRTVLGYALAVSVVTSLLFGLAPALYASRAGLAHGARPGLTASRRRLTTGLVVAEIAMAASLLIASGLLIRSFVTLSTIDPGFNASHVLTFQVITSDGGTPDQQRSLAETLVAQLETAPGIEAAAYARALPMVQLQDSITLITSRNGADQPLGEAPDIRFVSRRYVDAMGMRLLRGRGFSEADGPGRPPVMLINNALAQRDFGTVDPLGTLVRMGTPPKATTFEIVGVVDSVRQRGLNQAPQPQAYIDYRQLTGDGWTPPPLFPVGAYYAVRSAADTSITLERVRSVLRPLSQRATVDNIATMEQILANSIVQPRLNAVLLGLFAIVAAGLAAMGLYGTVAYAVSQRTQEIGVRMALGASRGSVICGILRESAWLIAGGLAIGLAIAWAVRRYLESLLFGVTPGDPMTFVAVAAGLATVGLVAAFIPARRGARIDPWRAIREDARAVQ